MNLIFWRPTPAYACVTSIFTPSNEGKSVLKKKKTENTSSIEVPLVSEHRILKER